MSLRVVEVPRFDQTIEDRVCESFSYVMSRIEVRPAVCLLTPCSRSTCPSRSTRSVSTLTLSESAVDMLVEHEKELARVRIAGLLG
jgi:hypothetical protein